MSIDSWSGGLGDFKTYWRISLSDRDLVGMDREQVDMIQDGLWLIEQASRRRTNGAVTPRLGLPVRLDAKEAAEATSRTTDKPEAG